MMSQGGQSQGGKRRSHPGMVSLTKGIVSEGIVLESKPTYNSTVSENKLINTNNEMEKLFESLERMRDDNQPEQQENQE